MIYAENILICIAAPLLLSLLFIHGKVRLYTVFFCIGMSICLISGYISGFLSMIGVMEAENTAVFISPVLEEIMKFLPLLFFYLLTDPDNESLFLSSIAVGVGFATFENCCYILTSGAGRLSYILVRGLATGVMHIVSILALSLGIMLVIWLQALSFPAIAGLLSLSTTFHALYNLLVSKPGMTSRIGYALPVMTAAALYLPYKNLRRKLSGAGHVQPEARI